MNELIIEIEDIEPIQLLGSNNAKFNNIKKAFPKLKIVSRGNKIKAAGSEQELELFKAKVNKLIEFISKYGSIKNQEILDMLEDDDLSNIYLPKEKENIICYGNNGNIIKAKTPNQIKLVDASAKNDIVFAVGPAGTGKTYTAVALAVAALKNKEVKRIILTRPAVEAGESLGFLPGDLKEKIDPYLRPLYDGLRDMIPAEKLRQYMEDYTIEVAPLAFMRGRTLDKAFIILDEAQNCTVAQLKMFLTRIGPSAKCIITGDMSQIDLPRNQKSGLGVSISLLEKIQGISVIRLTNVDVIRHRLVKRIISAFEKFVE
ncbi:MAG: PhoH family protein [Chitinophagales bacterium]